MTLGQIIKHYRTEHHLSQRQFAILCGVSNGYISMLEEGKNPKTNEPIIPSLMTLKKLASAMAKTLDELMVASDETPATLSPSLDVESTIGSNILKRRRELGLTQEELAKRMGYKSKSTINKIEMGINDIPQSKIAKFADVLSTSPANLIGIRDENLGSRIRQRRKELGMSADDLAEKLGKNRATVFRYENGDIGNLPLTVLEPLAVALSTDPSYLLGWQNDKAIGKLIKEERLRNSMSQEEVAEAIGVTKQAIYKYENGIVTNIPIENIRKMAVLFGITPADLLGFGSALSYEEKEWLELFRGASPEKRKLLLRIVKVALE